MTLIWVLVIFLFFILLGDILFARMYRNEKKPAQITPQKYGLPFKEIYIPSRTGARLYGWWIPALPDTPTLILIHGWGRNLSSMLPYIRRLHSMKYNLLAFDARNHGISSRLSHPTVGTFSEDALTVVEYLSHSDFVSSPGFGIVGLSIGGGAAINSAAWDERIKSVITIGALSHPIEVMNLEFQKRKIPTFIPWLFFRYMRLRYGIDFEKIAPVNNIRSASADILLIHGDKDVTIPLPQGQELARAGNADRTQLWIVPGKGHSNCDTHPQFWDRVSAFLQMTLPVSKQDTSILMEE
jgi:pimeloyl-ACP methyl ester carboxylesterase